jgi:hypothetical protein
MTSSLKVRTAVKARTSFEVADRVEDAPTKYPSNDHSQHRRTITWASYLSSLFTVVIAMTSSLKVRIAVKARTSFEVADRVEDPPLA